MPEDNFEYMREKSQREFDSFLLCLMVYLVAWIWQSDRKTGNWVPKKTSTNFSFKFSFKTIFILYYIINQTFIFLQTFINSIFYYQSLPIISTLFSNLYQYYILLII